MVDKKGGFRHPCNIPIGILFFIHHSLSYSFSTTKDLLQGNMSFGLYDLNGM
jgi:hypothetical protein